MEKTKDFTSGNVLSSLIKFAIPVFAALFLQSLYGAVDLLVVGQFAETADTSAIATGSLLMQTITMVVTGLSMGITVYVGQQIGEKNRKEAGRAIGAGIVFFALLGFIASVLLVVFTEKLAVLLHAPADAFAPTCDYIFVCGAGTFFIGLYNLLGAIFRGLGDSKTPLITVCIACVVNIVGDLLFVAAFGMGAMGAALATVLAQAISVMVSVFIILKKPLPFEMKKEYISFNGRLIMRELKIGAPIALQELLAGSSFMVIQTIANSIDVNASAGVGVAEKVCAFIMLVPSAYSQSMSAFVAQNIGAGKKDRALKALKCGIMTAVCMGLVIGLTTFFKGDIFAAIFSKDTVVIEQAFLYLKAYAIDTIFTSFLFCFIGYFNGCGNTMFVMVQGIVGAIGVRVPVALLISSLENTTLFHIGLATPMSTVVQIVLCFAFMFYMRHKDKLSHQL